MKSNIFQALKVLLKRDIIGQEFLKRSFLNENDRKKLCNKIAEHLFNKSRMLLNYCDC